MSYKTLKIVAILAVIFGIVGIGWGWKVQYAANHPSKSDAAYQDGRVPNPFLEKDIRNEGGLVAWCQKNGGEIANYDTQCWFDHTGEGGGKYYVQVDGNIVDINDDQKPVN